MKTSLSRGLPLLLVGLGLAQLRAQDVVINEIYYDPPDQTKPEEFIELHNPGTTPADISGWRLSEGVEYTMPPSTVIPPGGYLLVAENPAALTARFGPLPLLGPWAGRLDNDGEEVVLRDAEGFRVDEVDYGVGFPWPVAPRGDGSSMELIHPLLDNNLGGSWRASSAGGTGNPTRTYYISEAAGDWHYRRGTSEASTPIHAWRGTGFTEDASWEIGQTPIGYDQQGDYSVNTVLGDMSNVYSSVYLRKTFTIATDGDMPRFLKLAVYVDDGAIVYVNGVEVARLHVNFGVEGHDDFGINHEASWEEVQLEAPASFLQVGENVVAVHAFNSSIRSSDFAIDLALFVPADDEFSLVEPSPARENSIYSETAPPQIRQVDHFPGQPPSGAAFQVTARVTDPDGVASVVLDYQAVIAGNYLPAVLPLDHSELLDNPTRELPPNPEFESPSRWARIVMRDDGLGADLLAGDATYTATLPGQPNRTLVRYRITVSDLGAETVRVPYSDDPSLNFAAFVYDGVPPYAANKVSVHPQGAGHVYPASVLTALPVHFLITDATHLDECIAYSSSFHIPKGNENARDKFNWPGTFVFEGKVYDHIRYRLRQANDRYGGRSKRSMRFRFNKGAWFEARDNFGRRYPRKWRTLNTGKMFDNKDVVNHGLTETINANLWNMVGVPAPWFYTFHFRVIDGSFEAPPNTDGQFNGDFWGMHLGIEDFDPRFLDAHDMEDGNLYKLKDGIFNGAELLRNQGANAVKPDPDFQNIRNNLRPERSVAWLNAHVNYSRWYPYHTVCEGIRHYDFRPSDTHSKNRAWYFEPDYSGSPFGRLWTLPHDSDASWGPNWNSGDDYSKTAIFGGGGKPDFKRDYRNFIREFRDLLWTRETIQGMIDELASVVEEFSLADRDRWASGTGTPNYSPVIPSIESKVIDMKRFAFVGWSGSTGPTVGPGGRAAYLDLLSGAEGESGLIPDTPAVAYTGEAGFPVDGLAFSTSPFSDPQGNGTFGAMKWRIGEITSVTAPDYDPAAPMKWEWNAVWETEFDTYRAEIQIPATVLSIGHTYRARVRMMDATGRWSHWSSGMQFTTEAPSIPVPAVTDLRISEIMYNAIGGREFEYIELVNRGGTVLDLSAVRFTNGIEFAFADSPVTSLGPGEIVVIVENLDDFALAYDVSSILVAGEYSGRLDNGGERLRLVHGGNLIIQDFIYDDSWHVSTDGGGFSLTVLDLDADVGSWGTPENWLPSSVFSGTPGFPDDGQLSGGLQRPGDFDQNALVEIGDAVGMLFYMFRGIGALPCEGSSMSDGSNRDVLDYNGDELVDPSDVIYLLTYLYLDGPPHVLGTRCQRLEGCASVPCRF